MSESAASPMQPIQRASQIFIDISKAKTGISVTQFAQSGRSPTFNETTPTRKNSNIIKTTVKPPPTHESIEMNKDLDHDL